jgi:MFS family permease
MLYMTTLPAMTAFLGAAAGAKSMASLILFRFLAGTFGASPLTNSGGVVADMFNADQRGLGLIVFTAAPFLGPCVGPIVGGFGGMTVGWRWAEGVWAVFAGIMWIVGSIVVPETYAPILLQKRAARMTAKTGKAHVSIFEAGQGKVTARAAFQKTLARPWVLLFTEPIVFLLAAYQAILYGTLYMLFSAFPIVFRAGRGWNEGVSTLSYLGVICGEIFGVVYCIWDNKRYKRLGKNATPESRLPSGIVGGIAIPIGIFLFAWTNYMDIHWSVSIILVSPFGFGMVLVVLMCFNYLIDAYTIWAASVLAAAAVLRAIFGCVFPLFTTQMYDALGIHWASTIPGFIALACVPFPIVIARYGKEIRKRCKYSGEAYRLAQQSAS